MEINEKQTGITVINGKNKSIKTSKRINKRKCDTESGPSKNGEKDAFDVLARLLHTTAFELKEEAVTLFVSKITSKLKKVLIRQNLNLKEVKKVFDDTKSFMLGGIAVAPIYLSACAKTSKKYSLSEINVGVLIDFPFGESPFKTKIASVRQCQKVGADEVVVTLPKALFAEEHKKTLKKQLKKLSKSFELDVGVAVEITNLAEKDIKHVLKATMQSKVDFLVFEFGQASANEVIEKLELISKYKGKQKIRILANAETVESVSALMKYDIDQILTPFADDIARSLFERFNLKIKKGN